jgi:hypothetical protein
MHKVGAGLMGGVGAFRMFRSGDGQRRIVPLARHGSDDGDGEDAGPGHHGVPERGGPNGTARTASLEYPGRYSAAAARAAGKAGRRPPFTSMAPLARKAGIAATLKTVARSQPSESRKPPNMDPSTEPMAAHRIGPGHAGGAAGGRVGGGGQGIHPDLRPGHAEAGAEDGEDSSQGCAVTLPSSITKPPASR